MNVFRRFLDTVCSLRLTLFCLAAAFVLVFAGTLAQVRLGLFIIQEEYFQSWLIWWNAPSGGFRLPVFPGGHLIGAVQLVNLIAAHIRRFTWKWKKPGIQLTHLGLIIMLAGGLATDLFSVHSYMRIKEGATSNYSEDSMRDRLVSARAAFRTAEVRGWSIKMREARPIDFPFAGDSEWERSGHSRRQIAIPGDRTGTSASKAVISSAALALKRILMETSP